MYTRTNVATRNRMMMVDECMCSPHSGPVYICLCMQSITPQIKISLTPLLIDRFSVVLFSASEQTHGTLVICDSE